MESKSRSITAAVTHPLAVCVAAIALVFSLTLNCESHTVVGWALPDIVHSHPEDPVGPRRIVTYEIVTVGGQAQVLTDSGPYAGDAFWKATRLIEEEARAGKALEWYEVQILRRFTRHTGLIVPIVTRETFVVRTHVFDPKVHDQVPVSARRAAVDAFVAAWPAHARFAARLVSQDRVVEERVGWDRVVGELISYGLIAIVATGLWINIGRWRRTRRRGRAEGSPAP